MHGIHRRRTAVASNPLYHHRHCLISGPRADPTPPPSVGSPPPHNAVSLSLSSEPHGKLRPRVGHKEHMYLDPGSPPFTLPPSHPSPFVHSHEPPPPSDVVEPPPNLHPCLGAVNRGEKPLKSFPMLRLPFRHRELLAVARNSAAVALGRCAHPQALSPPPKSPRVDTLAHGEAP